MLTVKYPLWFLVCAEFSTEGAPNVKYGYISWSRGRKIGDLDVSRVVVNQIDALMKTRPFSV